MVTTHGLDTDFRLAGAIALAGAVVFATPASRRAAHAPGTIPTARTPERGHAATATQPS